MIRVQTLLDCTEVHRLFHNVMVIGGAQLLSVHGFMKDLARLHA